MTYGLLGLIIVTGRGADARIVLPEPYIFPSRARGRSVRADHREKQDRPARFTRQRRDLLREFSRSTHASISNDSFP